MLIQPRREVLGRRALLLGGAAYAYDAWNTPASAATFETTNRIPNGNFSLGSAGNPTNWSFNSWGDVGGFMTYPVTGKSGNACRANISFDAGGEGDAKLLHAPVTVASGQTYRYSEWYKSNVPSEINLEYAKVGGGFDYIFVTAATVQQSTWTQVTFDFTVPANVTAVRVMHIISDIGWLDLDEVTLFKQSSSAAVGMVSLTYDDGWVEHLKVAVPVLNAAGFKGTFYVCAGTGFLGNTADGYLTRTQIQQISAAGHTIGSHTLTHPHLPQLTTAAAQKEIANSKTTLEGIIGKPVTTFAYPYGEQNAAVVNQVKAAGYTSARIIDSVFVRKADPFRIACWSPVVSTPLSQMKAQIDAAKAQKQWLVIAIHRILNSSPDEYHSTLKWHQDLVTYVKTSGIKHVTVPEGLALHG